MPYKIILSFHCYNKTGIWHFERIPVFVIPECVMVSSLLTNHKHRKCTVPVCHVCMCVRVCVCVCVVCWLVHTKRSSCLANRNTLGKLLFSTHYVCRASGILRVGFGVFKPPPKFWRYRWSPRSHEQEEPASQFPFVVHCVLIWYNLLNKGFF